MQKDLDSFFRTLRIKWTFFGKGDKRSELEKKFYMKSDWEPPKACVELENFILKIQQKFDSWKPPRWIKDNLSKEERNFIKNIREDTNIVYMWEDKGPSFTKMTRDQYVAAGETEVKKSKFFKEIQGDPCKDVKAKCDRLVQNMFIQDEISENVSTFLQSGQADMPKFYHLLKTHKIPVDLNDPTVWLKTLTHPKCI